MQGSRKISKTVEFAARGAGRSSGTCAGVQKRKNAACQMSPQGMEGVQRGLFIEGNLFPGGLITGSSSGPYFLSPSLNKHMSTRTEHV